MSAYTDGEEEPYASGKSTVRGKSSAWAKSSAWDCALRLLGRRSHGRAELETKLAARQFDPDQIAEVMLRLDQSNLLDDQRFAIELTNYLFQMRGYSRKRIERTLGERGISSEVIELALLEIDSDTEYQQALRLGEKKAAQMGGLPEQKIKQRLFGFLARRGYSSEICYRVINHCLEQMNSDDFGASA